MKSRFPSFFAAILTTSCLLACGQGLHAASGTWANNTGDADANWSAGTNWVAGNVPGTTSLTTSNDEGATFSAANVVETPILNGDRRLGAITIDNTLADYSIGSTSPTNVLYLQNAGSITIVGGGTTTIDPVLRMGGTQGWASGGAQLIFTNGLSLASNSTLTLNNTSPVIVRGTVTQTTAGTLLSVTGSGSMIIEANMSNLGIASQANFSGTLTLSGNNTFTGSDHWRTGTLLLSSTNALGVGGAIIGLGSSTGAGPLSILTTGDYTVSRSFRTNNSATAFDHTIGGINTSGTAVFSGSISINNHNLNVTAAEGGVVAFTGTLYGAANSAYVKVGNGAVRFDHTTGNTYLGNTSVNAGTLLVNNESGSGTGTGAVTVNSTGTFGGTGSSSGAVTVNAGGKLSPGDLTAVAGSRAGTLGTGNLTFTGIGAGLIIDISGATAGDGAGFYDQVIVTGTVTLENDIVFTLNLDGYDPLDDGSQVFTIIANDGSDAIAGPGRFSLNGITLLSQGAIFSVGGQAFQISYTSGGTPATFQGGGNDIALLAVPEPTTVAIITAVLSAALFFRRRTARRQG